MPDYRKISYILYNKNLCSAQMAKQLLQAGGGDLFNHEIPQLVLLGAKEEPNRIARDAKTQLVQSCRNKLAYIKTKF